ncbi:MAG TPA: MFS transporter, partial [Candidatus Dormibacteraeota bacterium]
MTPQTALLVGLIGFVCGLGSLALTQLWLDGRRRQERHRWEAGERRLRLRPSLEPLLRAVIRFERFASRWSPGWRPALTDDARERARDLADELDEDAEVAEVALRLEGAAATVQRLRDLRAQLTRFRLLIDPPAGADPGARLVELGAVAAAITASLPDLKAVLLAELEGTAAPAWPERVPVPAAASTRARPGAAPPPGGAFAALEPLRDTVFRWLWLASLASQLGTWIQNVGAVDLMTLLAPTALLLALIQTATSLPGLALALPAGALADIVDRRRLLLGASAWMCGVSAVLTAVTFAHLASAWTLLALTFALGVGTVAGLPAWQAIIPDLVGRDRLAPAVTLSSVAINLARAIGPAIGGLAVALAGPGAAFALTASAFAFTSLVVLGWRRDGPAATLPAEGVGAAVWSGVRYSVVAAPVRAILIRAAGFIGCASALWALMPVVSRELPDGFAGYGGLLGAFGGGAVAGALLLGRIRRRLAPDALLLAAALVFAAAMLALGQLPSYGAALALMAGAGAAWVCALSTFNVCAQRA